MVPIYINEGETVREVKVREVDEILGPTFYFESRTKILLLSYVYCITVHVKDPRIFITPKTPFFCTLEPVTLQVIKS